MNNEEVEKIVSAFVKDASERELRMLMDFILTRGLQRGLWKHGISASSFVDSDGDVCDPRGHKLSVTIGFADLSSDEIAALLFKLANPSVNSEGTGNRT